MISKHHPSLPDVLLKEIGELLRQGRLLRKLSVKEAANNLLLTEEQLTLIEAGSCPYSGIVAQKIASFYGINQIPIDSLLYDWAIFQLNHQVICKRKNHLSLVESSPGSYEKESDFVYKIRKRIRL